MRVSPKYIIQLCQKRTKLHKRSHKYKEKGRRSIACTAGTLLVKRVPKKRTKKRQTQVKRQGSSETSRIKLEIVETSRIKLEIVETSRIKLGSVETSRIKLEIVETSRIKLETVETSRKNWKLIKHLAFQTEKTHRRERQQQLVAQIGGKVISLKVGKSKK